MKGIHPPGLAEQYFKQSGGVRLLGYALAGLAALVFGNLIGIEYPWAALLALLVGVITCAYAGMEAWGCVLDAPSFRARARQRQSSQAEAEPGISLESEAPENPDVKRGRF